MNPTEIRKLGKSGVPLTQLGFGGAPLGELFVRVDEATLLCKQPGTRACGTMTPHPIMAAD